MILNKILPVKDFFVYVFSFLALTSSNWINTVNEIQDLVIRLAIGIVTLVLLYFRIKNAYIDLKEKQKKIKD